MGQEVQAANDEIIQGLKYVVGATDRKYQWYTNEGQTVLRQAQRIQLPSRSLNLLTYVGADDNCGGQFHHHQIISV
ncbi:MAG: hypothetical protein EZS28_025198, partial [Streblomastix strix]